MTFNFTVKEFIIGNGTPTLQFYKKGFNLGGSSTPSWQDIILSGNTALTLVNAKEDGLNYLKLFGGTEQRNIPSEYTQVEYLESSGTQYINTGIVLNSEARITTVGQTLTTSAVGGPFSFWGFMGADTMPRWGWSIYQNRWLIDLNSTQTATFASLDTNKHTFINYCYKTASNKLVYNASLDGTIAYESDRVVDTVDYYYGNTLTAYIFARNNNNTVGNQLNCKIYSYQIEQNNVLVLNLIPCKRNSDNVLGMYDTVTGNFLTNQGSGDFTAGADATPSPDTPMDIICNNGVLKLSPNLFDKNNALRDGQVWGSAGGATDLSGYYGVNPIKIRGGRTYTRSGSHGSANYFLLDDNTSSVVYDGSATITVPDNALMWYFNNTVSTDRNTMMIVEGNTLPTTYMPYGSAYTDGTIETVKVHSKNLFDKNIQPVEGYWQTGGTWSADSNYNSYQYISVKPNTTYTVSIDENIDYWRIALFNNDTFIERKLQQYSNDYTFTTNATTNKLSFAFRNVYSINALQLEEGSTATDYEPYYYGGTATAEMLLAVDSYQDEQEILDGDVTRKVGVKVLDGSEDWVESSSNAVIRGATEAWGVVAGAGGYCTHLTVLKSGQTTFAGSCRFASDFNLYSYQAAFGVNSVEQFKNFLANQYANGTPIIVVYPLQTSTEETVTAQTLTTRAGTNIVEITEASIDDLSLEVSYKATV